MSTKPTKKKWTEKKVSHSANYCARFKLNEMWKFWGKKLHEMLVSGMYSSIYGVLPSKCFMKKKFDFSWGLLRFYQTVSPFHVNRIFFLHFFSSAFHFRIFLSFFSYLWCSLARVLSAFLYLSFSPHQAHSLCLFAILRVSLTSFLSFFLSPSLHA